MERCTPLLLLAVLSSVPSPVRAQTIRGEVVDGESMQPLEGSVVVVLDAEAATVLTTITSAEGRFLARLRDSGAYSLRVDRIGYESVTTDAFEVRAGADVFRRISIGVVPVSLEGIEVSTGRQCVVRPGEGALATARVWEQARTALTAAATTQRQRLLLFDVELYSRQLDARSMNVTGEERAVRRARPLIPFGGRDARDLAENGYIQAIDNGRYWDFYAPTADVLLSDSFLDTHCFRLEEGEDENEGLIGLRFEPVKRREVPDVTGTLWLDRATAALRHAEMRYVARDLEVPTEGALARVEFESLPGGRWIVDNWFIRMPQMVERRLPGSFEGSRRVRAVGSYRIEGGEITRITDTRGTPILSAHRYAARGVVYDSLRGRPLPDATIVLEGTAHRAVSDRDGRFELADIAPGRYALHVEHPRLDSLPEPARPRGMLSIEAGEPPELELATPALQTVVEAACPGLWRATPGSALPDVPYPAAGDALISGRIVDGAGKPLADATAHVGWDAFAVSETRIDVRRINPSVEADENGRFTVCGVPPDMPLSVWATLGERISVVVETRAKGRFAHALLVIGR